MKCEKTVFFFGIVLPIGIMVQTTEAQNLEIKPNVVLIYADLSDPILVSYRQNFEGESTGKLSPERLKM